MKKLLTATLVLGLLGVFTMPAQASPEEDLEKFRAYYKKRFPNVPSSDLKNGVYALDADQRSQWEDIEEFPPYELNIEKGKTLFETPFANGKTYASCFPNDGIGIGHLYPFFDSDSGKVITLEASINQCREANGEKKLKWKKGPIADISGYMKYTSRGEIINIQVPDDPRAQKIYEQGKAIFFAKRGQMNMSCADCHINNAGDKVRANLLSTAVGQATHWPSYRSKWGGMGTLQRRYTGCNKQVRFKPYKAQGPEYTALEYFHTYISNGQESNAPGTRM
jgi:sulfur-oxidizing protein SoxA